VTTAAASYFRPLTAAECEEHLGHGGAGRVAWNAPDGPMVLPVTYQLHLGRVSFRTSPYGALSCLAEPTNVAFEVDEIDLVAGTGWSVLLRGRAQAVTSSLALTSLWRLDGIVPWANGSRNLFIAIDARSTSGRMVRAPFAG
jgi:nitroimidazol reductase NimA-like FMN-containing flavoprotein (pyridoxamine 5'-phosphate oxidase superfamily)